MGSKRKRKRGGAYIGGDGRPLHLVEKLPDLPQVGEVCAVWIQGSFSLCAFRKGIDEHLAYSAGVNLKMESARHRVLPELRTEIGHKATDMNQQA